MKLWNVLGTVSRYVLTALSCISFAQFLLLLNVGTENAGRLAGQSLARGVISGLTAAVWFYGARKSRLPASANVQTQVQVTPPPQSQAQQAATPLGSIPATAPTIVQTTDHSGTSFLEEHRGFISLIAGVAIAVVISALATTGTFPQLSTLITGTSQPRFVHVEGQPSFRMFDNKTAQTCTTSPIAYDSVDRIKRDMHLKVHEDLFEEAKKKPTWPWDPAILPQVDIDTDRLVDTLIPKSGANPLDAIFNPNPERSMYPQYEEFYDRYHAVIANPDKPPVYHYDGMPYCKEL